MGLEKDIKQTKFKSAHQKALLNVLFTSEWISADVRKALKQFDLTETQFNILRILAGAKQKPLSPGEIKDVMIFSQSDLTRLIDRMLKKSLVERQVCPSNRRKVDIIISQKGKQLLKTVNPKVEALIQEKIGSKLSQKEADQLSELLEKLRSD